MKNPRKPKYVEMEEIEIESFDISEFDEIIKNSAKMDLEKYYDDYNEYEQDLTQIIKGDK